jgi:hypothetical protein
MAGYNDYLLAGPAKQLAKELNITEEHAMQILLEKQGGMKDMMLTGAGMNAGRGLAPRDLPQPSRVGGRITNAKGEPRGATDQSIDAYLKRIRQNSGQASDEFLSPGEISAKSRTEELKRLLPDEVLNRKWEPNPEVLGDTTTGAGAKEPPRGYGVPPLKQGYPQNYIEKPSYSPVKGADPVDKTVATQGVVENFRQKAIENMINELNQEVTFFNQPKSVQNANFDRTTPPARSPSSNPPVKVKGKLPK